MRTGIRETPVHRPRADWLPRAIMSGFIATVAMALLFVLTYGLTQVAAWITLLPARGAAGVTAWLHALTGNQMLDLAAGSLSTAAAIHLVVGVLWAMVYAYYAEPRLPGPDWVRGAVFALLPWSLSLGVALPLLGGGFFGAAMGAGLLPAIGTLILHLGYGLTLGVIYGPLGDLPADEPSRAGAADDLAVMTRYEQAAARGIVVGAGLGTVIGLGGAGLAALQPGALGFGLSPLVYLPAALALGATLGAFGGSLGGLTAAPARSPGWTDPTCAPKDEKALIPVQSSSNAAALS